MALLTGYREYFPSQYLHFRQTAATVSAELEAIGVAVEARPVPEVSCPSKTRGQRKAGRDS